ncbi:MAG: UvrD-helicase domain-containing protein [candidate division KSB1 bacterium]|nr:UvrD-helicase domain-containing protein [candidate division KSB1 bacterium]MDZ7367535.1 UvrD-helicase domain-containing protein [candidate division KSB1 bacterium]MDZ7404907.1 UvrD-helicase domain-containing protein [candidate division KSB1 bacterium]
MEALNPEQRTAVVAGDGPALVLAGAGSGKTRVLTHRIAYLIERKGVRSENILAATFTNKAAQEMHERLRRLVSVGLSRHSHHDGLWVGTFHSLCARILRQNAGRLGFTPQFSIYDSEDQLGLIRQIISALDISHPNLTPGYVHYRISRVKNGQALMADSGDQRDEIVARVYALYQQRLRENNAMDFDDLLIYPLELFRQHPDILAGYTQRFRYILVDEFQDTNRAQYVLLQALAGRSRNVFAVGDDDQSIYRWRGAEVRNLLDFERDFPDCKVFRLEQNYRSTRNILEAAHSVIAHNRHRLPKKLWTQREAGAPVALIEAENEFHEAQIILDKITEAISYHNGAQTGGSRTGVVHSYSFRDFAILYRTNAQSRVIEDTLRRAGIPYVIVGGLRFYERKEVKDVLAYMRLATNPADAISLRRIINYPLRGIGETTIQKLEEFARANNLTLYHALSRVGEIAAIKTGLRNKVLEFYEFINRYVCLKTELSLLEWANALVDATGIIRLLKSENAQERIDNIRELLNSIHEYNQQVPNATIEGYLERVSLITDIDTWDEKSNAVTLMTLHSAKGLEFPIVFITGLEEGLFPLIREDTVDADLEEERRLFYVGTTRAKEKLFLSHACWRNRFGNETKSCLPSRFLEELDEQFVRQEKVRRHRPFESYNGAETRSRDDDYDDDAPDYENESQVSESLGVGKMVKHPQFGLGEIRAIEGRGENAKLTIEFEKVGAKKILLKYGNLQVLSPS